MNSTILKFHFLIICCQYIDITDLLYTDFILYNLAKFTYYSNGLFAIRLCLSTALARSIILNGTGG